MTLKLDSAGPNLRALQNQSRHCALVNFAIDNEMTGVPVLMCACFADKMQLPVGGPRSMLGAALFLRNNFTADNGDINCPMNLPIIIETHEKTCLFDIDQQACCDGISVFFCFCLRDANNTSNGSMVTHANKMQ